MAVQEDSLVDIAFDLGVDDGAEVVVFDDFSGEPFDSLVLHPRLDMLSGILKQPIGGPFLIKVPGQVGDTDVVLERGEGRVGEILLHQPLALAGGELGFACCVH